MKKENLVIYDEDEEYISAFSEYINQLSEAAFSVAAFTKLEDMLKYVNTSHASAILLPEKLLCAEIIALNIEIYLLSENIGMDNMYEFYAIEKYQSGDGILREVSTYYAEKRTVSNLSGICNKEMQIYGVYSPIHRCGTTTFAITLAQQLGKTKKVLYINLEEFSGLKDVFLGEYISDLSDLMYFYLQNSDNMEFKFKASIYSYYNMDYIPPMSYSLDIRNIDIDVWCEFIKDIAKWSNYDAVIIDIGNVVSNIVKIFSICKKVFIPFITGKISDLKMNEFKQFIEGIKDVPIDLFKEIYIEDYVKNNVEEIEISKLCFGQYGMFVEKIIREVIKDE